jgi:hypothetical protein
MGNMSRRNMPGGVFAVNLLIIEEHVGAVSL